MSSPADPVAAPPSVWTAPDLVNPHVDSDKHGKVRRMFAAIAGSYDLNNRVHSLGRDQAWRRYAVRSAGVKPGEFVLDVACGTGDLTQAFAESAAERVVGLDFTREMLHIAGAKRERLDDGVSSKIRYVEGDAQMLPFAGASFDVVSIAFGIRNVANPALAIAEFARVLKPGGRLVVLEFGRPSFAPVRWFNDFYCGWVMPRTATWISRDRSGAYRYLPKSVGSFMPPEQLGGLMEAAGLEKPRIARLSFGICLCYVSQKPAQAE